MILVDTSVWIDSFYGGKSLETLNVLIDRREICVNDLTQNAMQNGVQLLSLDKHFELMSRIVPLQLYCG